MTNMQQWSKGQQAAGCQLLHSDFKLRRQSCLNCYSKLSNLCTNDERMTYSFYVRPRFMDVSLSWQPGHPEAKVALLDNFQVSFFG